MQIHVDRLNDLFICSQRNTKGYTTNTNIFQTLLFSANLKKVYILMNNKKNSTHTAVSCDAAPSDVIQQKPSVCQNHVCRRF